MRDRIYLEGMGGFLCPPGHPEHTSSVRFADGGACSLTYAVHCNYVSPAVRQECERKLAEYHEHKPALTTASVQAWIRQVLGYYASCYRNPAAPAGEQWHASKLLIDRSRDPLAAPEEHAGVNHVRDYYPEYQPSAADFANAKWGKRCTKYGAKCC